MLVKSIDFGHWDTSPPPYGTYTLLYTLPQPNHLGTSLRFHGNDDSPSWMTLTSTQLLSGNDCSISFWFCSSEGGLGTVISKMNWISNQKEYYIKMSAGKLHVYFFEGGVSTYSTYAKSEGRLDDNEWHHAVAVLKNGKALLYIDGSLVDTDTGRGIAYIEYMITVPLEVGRSQGATPWLWKGDIGHISLFNGVLDAFNVSAIYNHGNPFDLTTPNNYVHFLPGTYSNVQVEDFAPGQNWSVSIWFNIDSINNLQWQRLFNYFHAYSDTYADRIYLGFKGDSATTPEVRPTLWYYVGANATSSETGETELSAGSWYNATLVMENNNIKMYLNGVLDARVTSPNPVFLGGIDGDVSLGANESAGGNFRGKMGNAAFWKKALTEGEVIGVVNEGLTPDLSSYNPYGWWKMGDGDSYPFIEDHGSGDNQAEMFNMTSGNMVTEDHSDYTAGSSLVGYWKCTEGSGVTVLDSSTNSNNGTISGASWAKNHPYHNSQIMITGPQSWRFGHLGHNDGIGGLQLPNADSGVWREGENEYKLRLTVGYQDEPDEYIFSQPRTFTFHNFTEESLNYVESNNCIVFNGSNGYINFPDTSFFTFMGAFSISAWIKKDDTATINPIIAKFHDTSPWQGEWTLYIDHLSKIYFKIFDGSESVCVSRYSGVQADLDNWTNIVATYDGSGVDSGIKIYRDGELLSTTEGYQDSGFVAPDNTDSPMTIGAHKRGTAFSKRYFDGKIDEVAIFNRELLQADVTHLFGDENGLGNAETLDGGVYAYYRMEIGFQTNILRTIGGEEVWVSPIGTMYNLSWIQGGASNQESPT